MYTDLTGKRFGNLTVIEKSYKDKHRKIHWKCQCDCGNIIYPATDNLKSGNTWRCKSCGEKSKIQNIIGKKFGKITIIDIDSYNPIKCKCKCECGNIKIIGLKDLRSGRTVSCGCFARKKNSEIHTIHGKSHSRLFSIWVNMISRCENKNIDTYNYYGKRGISVCCEWRNDFTKFYEWAVNHGYKDNLTLDRIDNDKNYSPDNCRWATMKEQSNNTRRNRMITYNGETKTLQQWAEKIGLEESTLRSRLNRGWSVDKAIETPKLRNRCPKSVQ